MLLTHPLSAILFYMPPDLVGVLDPVPTDHFYADLDGDWDLDGDGRYGEYPDDAGDGGISWDADALVGRIPVYRGAEDDLDPMLEAIIEYETWGSPGYRDRLFLPAAFIGYEGSPAPGGGFYEETADGAAAAQPLYDAALALSASVEPIRFFEEDGIAPSAYVHEAPLTRDALVAEWSLGAGVVAAYGHGSTDGVYRLAWLDDRNDDGVPNYEELMADPFLTSMDTRALEGVGRAFTFHASCENGWPEDPSNLTARLLRNGAIGAVGASRAAMGGPSDFQPDPALGDADTMAYAFAHLLLEGASAGEAMAYLRYGLPADGWGEEAGIPLNGYGWMGKLEYNLYGDPTVGLGRCTSDTDCSDGSLCNGVGRCVDGYCVQGELVDCSGIATSGPCTTARCDPATGGCGEVPVADGTGCDDGEYCTVDDACTDGECAGSPRSCGEAPPGFIATCDDERRACVLEAEAGPDGGPDADAGPVEDAGPEPDGGPDAEAPAIPAPMSASGGCSAVSAPRVHLALPAAWL
jgi:hypothetical protein